MQGPTLSATASVTGTTDAVQATGSVTVAVTYPAATLSFDGAEIQAWLANDKWTRCEVALNGELMAGLIGTVEISETDGSPIQDASVVIVDERGTYHHPSSFLFGGQRVDIYITSRTSGGSSRLRMFRGNVEAASNDDAYVPRASLRASSLSRAWGDRGANMGILSVEAFAGYTWGELIQLYAASTCTPLTDFRGELGDEVYSSFDISGMSLVDLIQKWSGLIGIYLRETDGTLELVPERFVVGDLATSAYDFDQSNYLSIREDLPSRPVTSITASAVIPDVSSLDGSAATLPETTVSIVRVVNDDGSITETTTTVSWEIRWARPPAPGGGFWAPPGPYFTGGYYAIQTIEEAVYSDQFPGGVTDSGSAIWQLHTRTTTRNYYTTTEITLGVEPVIAPTGQLSISDVVVEGLYSPYCSTTYASTNVWTDGSNHIAAFPSFYGLAGPNPIERTTTASTYINSDTLGGVCKLSKTYMVREGYGSRLSPTGEQWDDGTYRDGYGAATNTEGYGAIEEQVETWADNADDPGRSTPYATSHTLEHTGWKNVGSELVGGEIRPLDNYVVDHFEGEYRTSRGSDKYDQLTVNGGVTKLEEMQGQIPDVPTAPASTPTVPENAVVITGSSMRNIYPTTRSSETLQDAQRISEIYRYIRRKLREALAVHYVVAHPMVPYLRVFDCVTITDPTRLMTAQKGYVTNIRRSFDLATGWAGQETTVAVTPEELDPVWP